jgi:hypothetical protein
VVERRREENGVARGNKVFDGKLEALLRDLADEV